MVLHKTGYDQLHATAVPVPITQQIEVTIRPSNGPHYHRISKSVGCTAKQATNTALVTRPDMHLRLTPTPHNRQVASKFKSTAKMTEVV